MTTPARNEPCPCGSGKRYKQCHGAMTESAPQRDQGMRLLHEALALQQSRRLDDARARYEKALALLPDSADGWHMLGVIDLEQGHLDSARTRITRALDLTDWRIAGMRHNLGLVLAKLNEAVGGRDADAVREAYRQWRSRAKGDADRAAPRVTVVVPAYNHAAYVEEALRSVFVQSYRPLDLVVIDDGSQDSTAAVAERVLRDAPIPARFESRANAGAAATLNHAIAGSESEFIQVLNSDDRLDPARVATMVAEVVRASTSWGFSNVAVIDAEGSAVDPLAERRAFELLCTLSNVPFQETTGFALLAYNVAVSSGNLFFSRELAQAVGPFADHRYNHDWDYALRLLREAEPAWVDAPLYHYRLHGANTITESAQAARDEAVRVCAGYVRWAAREPAPRNRFAPALATWGTAFVNAVLGGGMGEVLTGDELKALVAHVAPARPVPAGGV